MRFDVCMCLMGLAQAGVITVRTEAPTVGIGDIAHLRGYDTKAQNIGGWQTWEIIPALSAAQPVFMTYIFYRVRLLPVQGQLVAVYP